MAFDSNLPRDHSLISASELRGQLCALNTAITDVFDRSAANVDSLAPLTLEVSTPPTQADVQAVVDKLNDLIGRLKRGE